MLPRWLLPSLLLPLALPLSAEARGDEPARSAKDAPDRARIERLIERLGSPDFDEREAASRALEKIGPPAAEALRAAAAGSKDAEVRRRAADVVATIENGLEQLLIDYRSFGLPLPPKGAKLVRLEFGSPGTFNGKPLPKQFGLAFLVKPGSRAVRPVLFSDTDEWRPRWGPELREVTPDASALKDVDVGPWAAVSLAVQCHDRGWDELARALLEAGRKDSKDPPRRQLIHLAWAHWEVQLSKPKGDRARAAKHLKELIRRDDELDNERNRELLRSLGLALIPGKGKPGTVEALIDALVDYAGYGDGAEGFEEEGPYWRIANLGFDGVPALIEHLDDDRLTRAMMQGFNNFHSWNLRVRDVTGELLEGLAGHDIDRDWLRRLQGYRVTKADASRWWDEARRVGEEAYLMKEVLPRRAAGGEPSLSEHHLHVLAAKYPGRVLEVYRRVLDERLSIDDCVLRAAVLRCEVPAREKASLFLRAARHEEKGFRYSGFVGLRATDREQLAAVALAAIEKFPRDFDGRYEECPEAWLARVALGSGDPRVRQALHGAAMRASVGLRMELVNCRCEYLVTHRRLELLRYLASFLDDATVRDAGSGSKFWGDCAGRDYGKLEVRNFAALQIAEVVGIEVEVNPDRTPEQWARLRGQAREAADREAGKLK